MSELPFTKESAITALNEHKKFQEYVASRKYTSTNESCFQDVLSRIISELKHNALPEHREMLDTIEYHLGRGETIPAGSILYGLGQDSKCTLSNCYLTPIESDTIEAIFDCLKHLARTYSYRGGSGTDLTILRPADTPVDNAAISSTGAVSFMPMFSEVTNTIGQSGRRGALLMSLDVRHPDTPRFIWSKAKPETVFPKDVINNREKDISGANITVKMTNEFMQAVRDDADWTFRFPDMNSFAGEVVGVEYPEAAGDSLTVTIQVHKDVAAQAVHILEGTTCTVREGILGGVEVPEIKVIPSLNLEVDDTSEYQQLRFFLKDYGWVPEIKGRLIFSFDNKSKALYTALWDGNYERWEEEYKLHCRTHQTVKARDLMMQIAEAAWLCGDPGVACWDTVETMTPGTQIHPKLKPSSMNPCGEQTLSYWNNCLLSAIVLNKFVKDPYTSKASFDMDSYCQAARSGVYMLDILSKINVRKHPIQKQRDMDEFSRRIGQEVTGLADTLAMLGLTYGSEEANEFIELIMKRKAAIEIEASVEIASKSKPCSALYPVSARENLVASPYIKSLDLGAELKSKIITHGAAHTAWNTVGPCGSISIMSDNCTSGIEPLFRFSYDRKTALKDEVFSFVHMPAVQYLLSSEGEHLLGKTPSEIMKELNYIESQDINYEQRIATQASIQKYIDSSVSSTINLPNDASIETIYDIYVKAYEARLKGITVFRDGSITGILSETAESSAPASTEAKSKDKDALAFPSPYLVEKGLCDLETAERHRVIWKGSKVYVIVSLDEERNPIEMFAKLPREAGTNGGGIYSEQMMQEKTSHWDTICRLASLLFRVGMPVQRVISQLEKSSYSMVDAAGILARILRKYIPEIDEDDETIIAEQLGGKCPGCGEFSYVYEGGCGRCVACGYSDCG